MTDDKYKEPERIGLVKPISLANEAALKVFAQIAGEAVLYYYQDFMSLQTNVHWSHVDISLSRPIRLISYLILVNSYTH